MNSGRQGLSFRFLDSALSHTHTQTQTHTHACTDARKHRENTASTFFERQNVPKRAGDEKEVIQSQRETESEEGRQQRTRHPELAREDTEGVQRRVWDGGEAGECESAGEVNWRLKLDDMIQRDH